MMVHALKCVTFIISPTWNTRHVVRRNYTNKVQKFKTDKSAVTSSVGMKGEQGNNKWRVNDPAVECDNEFRCNDFSIQMLSRSLFEQIFGKVKGKPERCNEELIAKSLQELKKHGLPGNMEKVADVSLRLPTIFNDNIEEHFYEIGRQQSEPYRMLIDQFVKVEIPQMPHEWRLVAGWTKYDGEVAESVDYPSEDVLIFDVEICCLEGENPVLATAVGARHWYSWVSKDLCAKRRAASKKNIYEHSTEELIPMETSPDVKGYRLGDRCLKPKAVIGHSVSFDRARIKEQYWLDRTGLRFVDTMSLHIAVSGVTSFQKAMLKSGAAKDESWVEFASLNNSLNEVHKFYCGGLELKKELRGIFVSGHLEDVKKNFQRLVTYCAEDVMATHRIFTRLWPLFLERFPHPVTLAGMLELSSCYLPVNRNWRRYLENAQQTFDDMNVEAKLLLSEQADKSCQLLHGEKYKRNIWMWSENWQVKPFSLNKVERSQRTTKKTKNETFAAAIATLASTTSDETKKKTRGKEEEEKDEEEEFDGGKKRQLENKFSSLLRTSKRLPLRIPYLAGYPEWYRKLCYAPRTADWKPGPQSISTSMKVIPKVLSLTWNCMPLHYVNGQGWCYIVPYKTSLPLPHDEISAFPLSDFIRYCRRIRGENRLTNDNKLEFETEAAVAVGAAAVAACGLVKLPHKNGADLNVGNPLARDFINHFAGVDNRNAVQIIEISRQLSYWKNNKDRIEGQYVVWLSDKDVVSDLRLHGIGVILPMVTVSGTLTRRAVEPTWMTASNAVDERIGSELKAMIQAPPGYCMVGADVDSQELWIASLIGDSYHAKQHGCTPFGWMTLSGQKSDETDMHSVTAKSMGVSRADAKIINYARIYGAGEKFANRLLKQFVPGIDEARAASVARKMMRNTKGRRIYQLKADVLPEQKQRIFSSSGARQLSALYGKQVDELFGRPKWSDGSESAMFNSLEEIACSEKPETPFLGSRLTKALEPVADRHQRFMPTRINWVVQSSAVDFLHLILVCMRWLIDPRIRFSLSFHDEVRYLVPQSEKYQTALALHVTNLLTRCFCVQRLGMRDLPQSVAFFSAVEVDTVLRKDSTHDCITPSNPHGLSKGYGIPPGESLNIHQCIEKANGKIGAIKIPKTIR